MGRMSRGKGQRLNAHWDPSTSTSRVPLSGAAGGDAHGRTAHTSRATWALTATGL
jgi:hypothetical protein